jgi:hypothetical protein
MKYLTIIILMLSSCGNSNIEADAGVDLYIQDSVSDYTIDYRELDVFLDDCYDEEVAIAHEAEKCTSDIKEFWEYMTYIESLSCDDIRAGNYKDLC